MTLLTKAVEVGNLSETKLVEVRITGKLEKEDYQLFAPAMEELIAKHGKINMVIVLEDFHGWTAGALWEDVKFDARHFNDIARLAIVGEEKWEEGMAAFCKPFTTAKVKFFPLDRAGEAQNWADTGRQ